MSDGSDRRETCRPTLRTTPGLRGSGSLGGTRRWRDPLGEVASGTVVPDRHLPPGDAGSAIGCVGIVSDMAASPVS